MEPIDDNITAINTPAQASTYYLPFLISGEMDLMAIKKELREMHKLSEENVQITSRVLSNAHFEHIKENSGGFQKFLQPILGGLIMVGGALMILFLWNSGWVSIFPFLIMGTGASIYLVYVKILIDGILFYRQYLIN